MKQYNILFFQEMYSEEKCSGILRYAHLKELGRDIIEFYSQFKIGEYNYQEVNVDGETFEIPPYYNVQKLIGVGQHGMVVVATDQRTEDNEAKKYVVIKKMLNSFENKIFARRILRELRILRLLKQENILQILTIILPKSRQEFKDIYVVFPLMDVDMTSLYKSQIQLDEQYHQFYLYQILTGLKYLHSAKIIHRDLKPKNILINENNDIRIADFGNSKFLGSVGKSSFMTDYVVSRWYRAPQILLGLAEYDGAIDIWSAGCIFAELCLKRPFLRANNTKEQLELILSTFETNQQISEELQKLNINCLSPKIKKSSAKQFETYFKTMTQEGRDLLKRMLSFNPKNRPTAVQCLNHPYFKKLHLEEEQPNCEAIQQLQFQFQNYEFTIQQYKDLLYEETLLYHSQKFKKTYEDKIKMKKSLVKHILQNSNSRIIDPVADAMSDGEF